MLAVIPHAFDENDVIDASDDRSMPPIPSLSRRARAISGCPVIPYVTAVFSSSTASWLAAEWTKFRFTRKSPSMSPKSRRGKTKHAEQRRTDVGRRHRRRPGAGAGGVDRAAAYPVSRAAAPPADRRAGQRVHGQDRGRD